MTPSVSWIDWPTCFPAQTLGSYSVRTGSLANPDFSSKKEKSCRPYHGKIEICSKNPRPPAKVRCDDCKKTFATKKNLQRHKKSGCKKAAAEDAAE